MELPLHTVEYCSWNKCCRCFSNRMVHGNFKLSNCSIMVKCL